MKANVKICKKCKKALEQYKKERDAYYTNYWTGVIRDEVEPFDSFEEWRSFMFFVCGECQYKLEHMISDSKV